MSPDIFDRLSATNKPDIFDRISSQMEKDIELDQVVSNFSKTIKDYTKAHKYVPPPPPKPLDMDEEVGKRLPPPLDVIGLKRQIKLEVLKDIPPTPPQQIIHERIVEKQKTDEKLLSRISELEKQIKAFKKQDEKEDDRKYAEKSNVEELKKEISDLKDKLEGFRTILPMLSARGGSGVLGLPSPAGHGGQFLTTDGNQFSWSTVTQGSGASGTSIFLGTGTSASPNNGDWQIIISGTDLSFQRYESGVWVEKSAAVA